MGLLFRQSRQPTQQEIDAVAPPSDEDLLHTLAASAAGFFVLIALKLAIGRWTMLPPSAEGDQLGAELWKGVPVAGGMVAAYLVFKLMKRKDDHSAELSATKQD